MLSKAVSTRQKSNERLLAKLKMSFPSIRHSWWSISGACMAPVIVSIQRPLVIRNIDLLFPAGTIQQPGTTNVAASAVLCVRSISTRITLLFTIASTTVINAIIVCRVAVDSLSISLATGRRLGYYPFARQGC